MFRYLHTIALITLIAGNLLSASGDDAVITSDIAKASTEHLRNSEGDLLVLRDGSLFAAWSQFFHDDRVLLSYYDFPLGSKELSLKFRSLPITWLPR